MTIGRTTAKAAAKLPKRAAELDPIFAAIERHIVAFRLSLMKRRIRSSTDNAKWAGEYDPVECKAVEDADTAARSVADNAAYALTTVQPTTMAGILALIGHFEVFNAGAVFLDPDTPEDTVDDWRSCPADWPADSDNENIIDMFGYSVLANVRRALEPMAGAIMTTKATRRAILAGAAAQPKLCETKKGVRISSHESMFFDCLLDAISESGEAPPPALGLPQSVLRVVDYEHVKLRMVQRMLREDDDTPKGRKRHRERVKTVLKRAREGLMACKVVGCDAPYVWWTGKPVREVGRRAA